MTFPVRTEIDVDGTWVDISDRPRSRAPVVITRGRGDEASPVQAANATMTLANTDGALTPQNPESPWYPHIDRGLPVRVSIDEPVRSALRVDGQSATASTADHASLDITGDIDVRFEGRVEWAAGGGSVLAGKYTTAGDQRSWLLLVHATRRTLQLLWSPDGTLAARQLRESTAPVPWYGLAHGAVRVTLDVDDGGDHTVTFWIADTRAGPWVQLGDPVTEPGTTSVHGGTSAVGVGSANGVSPGLTAYTLAGDVYGFELRNGIAGTVVTNPDFAAQTPGATSFVDGAGRTWDVGSNADIVDRRIRFHGRVADYEVEWPLSTPRVGADRGTAHVKVTAAGPLRRMRQGAPTLESTLRRLLTSPSVEPLIHAYWPLEDGRDAAALASPIPGVAPMQIRGQYSLASDSSLAASAPLLNISSGNNAYMAAPIPQTIAQVPGVEWEVTRFFRIDDPVANPALTQLMAVDTNGRVATWRIGINDVGVFISGRDVNEAAVVSTNFPVDDRFFDTWAMIVLEVVDDGVDVDWTVSLIPVPLGVVFGTNGTYTGNTGVPHALRNSMTGPPSGISTGHVIVTSGAPIGWLAGADNAWVGETAAHRFRRLCVEEGTPFRVIGDPTTHLSFRGDGLLSEPMGPQRQAPLLDLLQECADTDGGIMFEDRISDALVFRTRRSLHNQTAAVTLDADDRSLTRSFAPVLDDLGYVNELTVSRPDGSSANATTDPPAGDRYEDAVEINVHRDAQLPSQAGWRLHHRSSRAMRARGFGTSIGRAPAAVQAAWSDAEIGDRVQLANLPRQHPQDGTQILDGYTERLEFHTWRIDPVNGSPAAGWEIGVRDDEDRGRRDTAGTELSAPMTDSATVAEITVTAGPDWTTEAGDYPFDLDIGGERVTATGLADLGGGPFFVVTRSVNGIVKAHAVGTAVRLWRPTIRAI